MFLKQASDWLGRELPGSGHGEHNPASPLSRGTGQSHGLGSWGAGATAKVGPCGLALPQGLHAQGRPGPAGDRASTSLPPTWGSHLGLGLGSPCPRAPHHPAPHHPAPHQPAPEPPGPLPRRQVHPWLVLGEPGPWRVPANVHRCDCPCGIHTPDRPPPRAREQGAGPEAGMAEGAEQVRGRTSPTAPALPSARRTGQVSLNAPRGALQVA